MLTERKSKMCGILAVINSKFDKHALKIALNMMLHRGPDNQNELVINNQKSEIYLGHNRLSIIDLDTRSNQPFTSHKIHIVYNGEIYNYKELIIEHNLKVRTKSDTEVLLEMYRKYSHSCLKYLNGMFAFVIYDENTGDIFAARDRLGVKPLYYKKINSQWIFSSEIASILRLTPSDFDDFGIRQYRKLRMTIKGHTIYKDIKDFPPAHFFLNGNFFRYWDLEIYAKDPPIDEELRWLIEDSILLRKRSDVPVGSYLSGGLDSTILTYILKPEYTWSVGFEELNEFEWSELAAKKVQSKHHNTIVDHQLFMETLKWMIKKRREPLSVPNEVLLYLMTKSVKTKNTVVLSGEGADELFWGYDKIFRWANQADCLDLKEFDKRYCYGTNEDYEIIEFALHNLPGERVVDKVAYYFQVHHLQGLLRRLDNSTMLCSVEAREPFVDYRLVELLAGTSFDWRMGGSVKEPLKRIYKKLIPEEILTRSKVGFPVPLESIFSGMTNLGNSPMDNWLIFNLNELTELG